MVAMQCVRLNKKKNMNICAGICDVLPNDQESMNSSLQTRVSKKVRETKLRSRRGLLQSTLSRDWYQRNSYWPPVVP